MTDWKDAPEFGEPPPESSGDESPPQRKTRSDKGQPRGPRSEGTPRRRTWGSLKEPIGGMLVMLNLPIQMLSATDALDVAELDALASALDEQCKLSPRFRKYVESMLGVASGGQLIAVVGMISARRLARHGFLGVAGETVDATIGAQLAAMTGEEAVTPTYMKEAPKEVRLADDLDAAIQRETEAPIYGGIPAVGGTNIS